MDLDAFLEVRKLEKPELGVSERLLGLGPAVRAAVLVGPLEAEDDVSPAPVRTREELFDALPNVAGPILGSTRS